MRKDIVGRSDDMSGSQEGEEQGSQSKGARGSVIGGLSIRSSFTVYQAKVPYPCWFRQIPWLYCMA